MQTYVRTCIIFLHFSYSDFMQNTLHAREHYYKDAIIIIIMKIQQCNFHEINKNIN